MKARRTYSIGLGAMLVLVATLAACSEDGGPTLVLPSSAFPSATGSTSATGATGSTGATGLPTGPTGATGTTGSPSVAPGTPGDLGSGQAALSVTGDVQATKVLANLVSSVYAAPPGGMAIVWTAGGTDATTLGIGGLSFTGTQPTAPTLSLTLTVQTSDGLASFISTSGECTVTIGVASAGQVSGVFTCSGLVGSSGEVVDASGSFSAQG